MLFKRTSSKSLTRKKESKIFWRKEKKRRTKEEKVLHLIDFQVIQKSSRITTSLISLRIKSLRITLAPQMMIWRRRWRTDDLRNLVRASRRWSKLTKIMVNKVLQVFHKKKKKNQLTQKTKSTSDRTEISLTGIEFQSKTMKWMLLSSFLQVLIVADHPTTETASNLMFHLRITSLNEIIIITPRVIIF